MELGAFSLSLAVKDIEASKRFMKSWDLQFLEEINHRIG
jgi:hypothetical protein